MLEKKNSILVVDDELQIRKNAWHFPLMHRTSASRKAIPGKQAVRMCASIKPDLLLLDLGLPDMDGKDVIDEIRSWSQVPIIVLSVPRER